MYVSITIEPVPQDDDQTFHPRLSTNNMIQMLALSYLIRYRNSSVENVHHQIHALLPFTQIFDHYHC